MTFEAGRFVLTFEGGYVTSWDTWEDAAAAFEETRGGVALRMPSGFQLEDGETGRVWSHGALYEWEAAAT